MALTAKHIERSWTLLTIAGGALTALWIGYGWIAEQNGDKAKLDTEVAPVVAELTEQTDALRRYVRAEREDKLAAQMAMEAQCEKPGSDLPNSYCDQVLDEKRVREARELAKKERP